MHGPMTRCFSTVSMNISDYKGVDLMYLDSGHGGQTKDLDGDEADGFDEGSMAPSHVLLFRR